MHQPLLSKIKSLITFKQLNRLSENGYRVMGERFRGPVGQSMRSPGVCLTARFFPMFPSTITDSANVLRLMSQVRGSKFDASIPDW